MTPREQWIKFYQHQYNNGKTMPDPMGLHVVAHDMTGLHDRGLNSLPQDKDWFGCEWVVDGSIGLAIPDPRADFPLKDVADWREVVKFPDLDAFDFETAYRNSGLEQVDRTQKLVYFNLTIGPWERLHALMGFEEGLMALMSDPEECDAFFTAFMDWRCKLLDKIKEYYNPDVIMYHDDIGTQLDMMLSPELWRKLMKPHLKRATEKIHSLGIFMEYHSCGKLEQVVPDLVEIGVDAWQGQEINDILALKKLTDGKLEYHSLLDYATMVTAYNANTATMEDVRAFVRKAIQDTLVGGHYAPMMQPFNDEVTTVMTEEYLKVCKDYIGEPA